eukprot:Pompholyxophrys_punicea_v1_NODE_365_length_2149_cov_3.664756.p1 type:complete len:136 gc:universal NODE_365_length_2149_cov_3.664756:1286-879(-)
MPLKKATKKPEPKATPKPAKEAKTEGILKRKREKVEDVVTKEPEKEVALVAVPVLKKPRPPTKKDLGGPKPRDRYTNVGVIFSCGANTAGELGVNPEEKAERSKPGTVPELDGKDIVDIRCGGMHSAALSKDGKV